LLADNIHLDERQNVAKAGSERAGAQNGKLEQEHDHHVGACLLNDGVYRV
jgi:hypothetical protein